MFKKCLLIFLLCLLSSLVHAESRSQTAIRAFNAGVQKFNAKNFNEAISDFDEALSYNSDFAEAYFARGACKHYLKGYDGALMDLNDALRRKSDYVEARALRGALFYETDRWDDALQDFDYVLERKPTDAQALLGRGVIYLKRENTTEAAKNFRQFLRAHPDDALAPKLRQLLASLSKEERDVDAVSAPTGPGAGEHQATRPKRSSVKAQTQALSDALFSNSRPLSERFGNKVLRGERSDVVGDIREEGPRIVEPQ